MRYSLAVDREQMAKTGRNDLCPCGSGRKYKKCCEAKDQNGGTRSRMMLLAVGGAVLAAILAGLVSLVQANDPLD